ncbi:Hypothetical predicted protein [Podarcis lilfordi]|uniref:Uncharacterized protein n=1 Tax=Podarcis lilfordi TaxID=74358 RepID=A0AA35LL12_9SAUR|nr:Hypothetical predicted protein [Podarcis lilfordi]
MSGAFAISSTERGPSMVHTDEKQGKQAGWTRDGLFPATSAAAAVSPQAVQTDSSCRDHKRGGLALKQQRQLERQCQLCDPSGCQPLCITVA